MTAAVTRSAGRLDRLRYAGLRWLLGTAGRLSAGVMIGLRHGFDSGPSLDYVYRDQAGGVGPLGRWLDRIYLDQVGWRAVRARRVLLQQALLGEIQQVARERDGYNARPGSSERRAPADAPAPVHVLDVACGGARYVLDVLARCRPGLVTVELRDIDAGTCALARERVLERGLRGVVVREASAFDALALAGTWPRPDIAIVSGFYELCADDARVLASLRGVHGALRAGGALIYTNQPWHPQLELIAGTLTTREGGPWVMRCRPQAEMDGLVRAAGFTPRVRWMVAAGIYTVSVAGKGPGLDPSRQPSPGACAAAADLPPESTGGRLEPGAAGRPS